jgi:hypothetical protein
VRRTNAIPLVLSGLAMLVADASANSGPRQVTYRAPDRQARAIVHYQRPVGYGTGESRVDIKDRRGCSIKSLLTHSPTRPYRSVQR